MKNFAGGNIAKFSGVSIIFFAHRQRKGGLPPFRRLSSAKPHKQRDVGGMFTVLGGFLPVMARGLVLFVRETVLFGGFLPVMTGGLVLFE